MKTTTLLFLLFTAFSVIAQDKFFTNTGTINFEASVPLYEEVKAVNRQVAILLEPKTSTFICTVVIKDFRFKLNLMQEHFNENYMESNRYPKAIFKGKIQKFDLKDITEVAKQYVHGSDIKEGMLNRVESTIRCYDPCLSCSTHAIGKMPLKLELYNHNGELIREHYEN